MKRVKISIHFKNDKGEPKSATALNTEIELDRPGDLVRDIFEVVRKHASVKDLQIPLFGNGNVMISELTEKVKAASARETKD